MSSTLRTAGPPSEELTPQAHLASAHAARLAGQHRHALPHYYAALRSGQGPLLAEAAFSLGLSLAALGLTQASLTAWLQTLQLQPHHPQALCQLASAALQHGDRPRALQLLQQGQAHHPTHPDLLHHLAQLQPARYALLAQAAQYVASHQPGAPAAQATPPCPNPWFTLAVEALRHKHPSTLSLLQAAVLHQPSDAQAHRFLGATQLHHALFAQAAQSYRTALRLAPHDPALQLAAARGLGKALAFSGDPAGLSLLRSLVHAHPGHSETVFALSNALLAHGFLAEGFQHYESRFDIPHNHYRPYPSPHPEWDGSPLLARTVVIRHEQGFGDTIQFARYLPHLASLHPSAHLLFEAPPSLCDLLGTLIAHTLSARGLVADAVRVLTPAQAADACFDLQIRLVSLPRLLRTDAGSLPPMLIPPPALSPAFPAPQPAIPARPSGSHPMRIGLVWAGDPAHVHNHMRSAPLQSFLPLTRLSGLSFHSIQQGAAAGQASGFPFASTHAFPSWTQTAEFLPSLHLLLSVDTSPAHLAATLGLPTWVLLATYPDWRWGLSGLATPWYPSMRLFRQSAPGDWAPVLHQVASALQQLL